MSVDWNVLKTDYVVHGELTLAALAEKYKVTYRLVRETAAREHWEEERAVHVSRVQHKALALAEDDQAAKLAEVDSVYLRQAEQIRDAVSIALMDHRKPHELRQLQAAAEGSLRMAHLCLGAATMNTQVVSPVDASCERVYQELLAMQQEEDSPCDDSGSSAASRSN